jgi:putative flippase GtrA
MPKASPGHIAISFEPPGGVCDCGFHLSGFQFKSYQNVSRETFWYDFVGRRNRKMLGFRMLLDRKMNFPVRQFSTFAAVGVVATAVHYSVLIGLVEVAQLSAVAASLAGFCAGGLVSYGLNREHTFRSKLPHEQAGARFALVVAVGFGLTYLLMTGLVDFGSVPYLPAQVLTTGLVFLWTFAAHRTFTFGAGMRRGA